MGPPGFLPLVRRGVVGLSKLRCRSLPVGCILQSYKLPAHEGYNFATNAIDEMRLFAGILPEVWSVKAANLLNFFLIYRKRQQSLALVFRIWTNIVF